MPVALDERLCSSYVIVTPEVERTRAYRCVDMACRVWTPRALRAQGLVADAERIESLGPVVDEQTAYAGANADASASSAAYTNATAYAASRAHADAYAAAAARARASAAYAAYAASAADANAAAYATARSEAIALLLELCETGRQRDEADR
jgi:hypothetical protein